LSFLNGKYDLEKNSIVYFCRACLQTRSCYQKKI